MGNILKQSQPPDWQNRKKAHEVYPGPHVLYVLVELELCEAEMEGEQEAAIQLHRYSFMHGEIGFATEYDGSFTCPSIADTPRPIARR